MPRRPRVAFVVARCGAGVIGGAERLCLETASHMAESWDVEILTTCATDYATWKNEYAPGLMMQGNVPVRRFPVDRLRDRATFDRLSAKLSQRPQDASAEDQAAWMAAQGPACSALSAYLEEHATSLDAVYFYSYLYATTYDNVQRVAAKAVLVSLAHDEWMLRLPMWNSMFESAQRVVCLTPEEEHLLASRFAPAQLRTSLIALGIDEAAPDIETGFADEFETAAPYALYVGRVDAAKNCAELVRDFIELATRGEPTIRLVLMGPVSMTLPDHPSLKVRGPVGENVKRRAMAQAAFVVVPSLFESLSLVALESWRQSTAVLVNGGSSVLVGQCRRSGGGVWYGNRAEFAAQYTTCLQGRAEALGRQGNIYVKERYRWDDVTRSHRNLIERRPARTS